MLYTLNLMDKNSFETMLNMQAIPVDWIADETFFNMSYESVTAYEHYSSIKNIFNLIVLLQRVEKDDLIWVRSESYYAIAKVKQSAQFNSFGAKIAIKAVVYEIFDIPSEVVMNLDKFLMSEIKDRRIILESDRIFNYFKEGEICIGDENSEESLQLEFVKDSSNMLEVRKKYDIMPYKKSKINVSSKITKKKREVDNNFGELIIELYPPDKKEEIRKYDFFKSNQVSLNSAEDKVYVQEISKDKNI